MGLTFQKPPPPFKPQQSKPPKKVTPAPSPQKPCFCAQHQSQLNPIENKNDNEGRIQQIIGGHQKIKYRNKICSKQVKITVWHCQIIEGNKIVDKKEKLGELTKKVEEFVPIESTDRNSDSDNIGQTIQDVVEQLQKSKETLKNIFEIFQLFAVEEKITTQAFNYIIQIYSQKNDASLNNTYIPLIVKIHSKIYDRLTQQINEIIKNEINIKMKEYEVQFNNQKEENDILSKIDALAEELKEREKKIHELEEEMNVQVKFVEMCQHNNDAYKVQMSAIQEDRARLQKKIEKYSSVLKPYQQKKKQEKVAKRSEYIKIKEQEKVSTSGVEIVNSAHKKE